MPFHDLKQECFQKTALEALLVISIEGVRVVNGQGFACLQRLACAASLNAETTHDHIGLFPEPIPYLFMPHHRTHDKKYYRF